MAKRLVIDLGRCDDCDNCGVECAYFYRPNDSDHGALSLREAATFALICRRCEEPGCVAACKFDALERQEDGVLKRYNMRCVSCKCCSHACPFGTIYPEAVPFYATKCDYCIMGQGSEPPCVASCENKALDYREMGASAEEGDMHILGEHLAVRAAKWEKKDV